MRGLADASLMLGAAILVIAALVHFYWAADGRTCLATAVPEASERALFVPSSAATIAAGMLVGTVGLIYAAVALDLLSPWLPAVAIRACVGLIGLVFVARAIGDFQHVGVFNRGGDTGFARADRLYYSPLCFFLGVSGLLATATHIP